MDRGSRLITLFQTLEKVQTHRPHVTKLSLDDLQQIRYATSKILQYLTSSEKVHRDLILRNSNYLDILFGTLECYGDTCVEQNIIYIITELIGKSHTGKRVTTLVSHGATHVLLQTLVYKAREQNVPDEFFISLHQVLAKLGPKDRKFGVKARLSQALPVTLSLIRNNLTHAKTLQPILQVLKLYAANAVNASYLGKNGAVTYLYKILHLCGKKHLTLLKYALDTLALLVKTKSNSARAIGHGGVPVLLTMFWEWHRSDTKHRHIQLRKALLQVLKHITNLKSGRKALMEADGIRLLYTTCQETLDVREVEGLIIVASMIMRKCFPRNRLPLDSLRSPLSFPLPDSEFHVLDTGHTTGEDNEYESSVDNDDDISSDEELDEKVESDRRRNGESPGSPHEEGVGTTVQDDGDLDLNPEYQIHRTFEDLCMYKQFFPELHEFDAFLDDEILLPVEEKPIVIPTASFEVTSNGHSRGLHATKSASMVLSSHSKRRLDPSHQSMSAFTGYHSADDYLLDAFKEFGLNIQKPGEMDTVTDSGLGTSSSRSSGRIKAVLTDSSGSSIDSGGLSSFKSANPLSVSSKLLSQKSQQPKTKRKSGKGANSKGPTPGSASSSAAPPQVSTAKTEKSHRTSLRSSTKAEDWFTGDINLVSSQESSSTNPETSESEDIFDHEEMCVSSCESLKMYEETAARTKSVGHFNKLAYPDMHGSKPPPFKETLYEKRFGIQRQKVFEDIDRFINPDHVLDQTVYDVDAIIANAGAAYQGRYSNNTNTDETRIPTPNQEESPEPEPLTFNSQFESGNLRKAIQIRKHEYDLILNPDINTNHHHQWFYFEVGNMAAGVKYRFNIINCEKVNSQFNFGMKPVMYSVAEAVQGRPYWTRVGTDICYYKNHFTRSSQTTGGVKGKSYYTATFTITFKHHRDVCYLAYHYPYTYSMLQAHIHNWETTYDSSQIYFKNQVLTETLSGNSVPVLTITSHPPSYDREGIETLKSRPYIFLSSRVHPGESNASWVMRGTMDYLLSNKPNAQTLRDMYIFKVVPMLNPDGVINGSHRCSLVAEDLNRRWMNPCPRLHPTIYHTKGLLQYLHAINKSPLVFCDYHGHSRRKNVFLYGCAASMSWMTDDTDNPAMNGSKVEDTGYKTLPRILHTLSPSFSLCNCSFVVEKTKESTARVVVWRQIGVIRSYTMESSYCGCDQGPYRGQHITTRELEEMGQHFCEGLAKAGWAEWADDG